LKKTRARACVRENSPRLLPPVRKPHPRGERRAVTTATTLEKGIRALESASPAAPFDVTLLEEKQAEPLFLAAAPAAGGGGAASKDLPAGVAGSAQLALGARFAKLASECAIVLMHEEEDVGNKAYMIEAIRVGVVDVVRFPLVAQSMRTLWQHAVRRMIRVAARETRRSERPASARASGGGRRVVGGTERRSDRASADSGDSTASEEGRLKRGASSPESVLPETVKSGAGGTGGTGAATGGKRKAGATGSSGSGSDGGDKESAAKGKEDGGKKSVTGAKAGNAAAAASGPAGKPKPQPRSTQQWRAAEQRGRRLAIKPHTAVVGGVAGVGPGSLNPGAMPGGGAMRGGGGVYYHSGAVGGQPGMAPGAHAHAGVLGQTQTMTINGQQVQVWVPMNASGGNVAYGAPGQGGRRGGAGGALGSSPPRGEEGEGSTGGPGHFYAAPNAGAPQMFHGHPGAGGGMLLVQQANGQQVWVPAQPGHHGMHSGAAGHGGANGAQMWKEDTTRVSDADVGGTRGDGALRQMEAGAVSQMSHMSQMRGADGIPGIPGIPGISGISGIPSSGMDGSGSSRNGGGVPLGLGLKRSDSLQQMVESSGLLDGDEPNARVASRGEAKAGGSAASRAFDGSKLEGGAMDADMFRDAEMLEEDALDAILAHARDGNLLSFDGMDEAMLEAAAGPEQGVRRA
jgi:hypothetical protein